MTRLERAALDYAIACLSRGDSVSDEVCDALGPEARHACASADRVVYQIGATRRLLVTRLALYLRLLRRVDAWETRPPSEWPDWSCPVYQALVVVGPRESRSLMCADVVRVQYDQWFGGYMEGCRLKPWHPLWLDAPPHDPAVTPRMRREAKR